MSSESPCASSSASKSSSEEFKGYSGFKRYQARKAKANETISEEEIEEFRSVYRSMKKQLKLLRVKQSELEHQKRLLRRQKEALAKRQAELETDLVLNGTDDKYKSKYMKLKKRYLQEREAWNKEKSEILEEKEALVKENAHLNNSIAKLNVQKLPEPVKQSKTKSRPVVKQIHQSDSDSSDSYLKQMHSNDSGSRIDPLSLSPHSPVSSSRNIGSLSQASKQNSPQNLSNVFSPSNTPDVSVMKNPNSKMAALMASYLEEQAKLTPKRSTTRRSNISTSKLHR